MSRRTWPAPSRSRRVRTVLTLAEGAVIGGFAAALFLRPLLGGLRVLLTDAPLPPSVVVVLVLFGVAFLYKVPMLARATEHTPDRTGVWKDWHETRRWSSVIAVASVVVAAVSTGSLAIRGWPAIARATPAVTKWAGLGVAVAGFVGYVYAWRRLGEF